MPDGDEIEWDIVERPESVLVLPVGQKGTLLLFEEYYLGADTWQLTIPGGKVMDPSPEGIRKQAERGLRKEIGLSSWSARETTRLLKSSWLHWPQGISDGSL